MHSSHPVHSAEMTPCIRFGAPQIASTGHASMHSVQPMHHVSSMQATVSGPATPRLRSSGTAARPVNAARAARVASPPGGQRLISAPRAMDSA